MDVRAEVVEDLGGQRGLEYRVRAEDMTAHVTRRQDVRYGVLRQGAADLHARNGSPAHLFLEASAVAAVTDQQEGHDVDHTRGVRVGDLLQRPPGTFRRCDHLSVWPRARRPGRKWPVDSSNRYTAARGE